MPFVEDMTPFFDSGEFATTCTFQQGINTASIDCIFFKTSDRDGSIINNYFYIDAPSSTTNGYIKGDKVTINGVKYRILSKEITSTDGAVNRFELTLDQAC